MVECHVCSVNSEHSVHYRLEHALHHEFEGAHIGVELGEIEVKSTDFQLLSLYINLLAFDIDEREDSTDQENGGSIFLSEVSLISQQIIVLLVLLMRQSCSNL